jgi:hypothetical protein
MIGTLNEKAIRLNVITLDFGNDLAESDEEDGPAKKTDQNETKN